MILDVPTRWNSTFDMIERAMIHRKSLNCFIASHKPKLKITDTEWNLLIEYKPLLNIFKGCSLLGSQEGAISISKTLINYKKAIADVEAIKNNKALSKKIQFAANAALTKLGKYDQYIESEPYWVAASNLLFEHLM